jgi:hypothetical protein
VHAFFYKKAHATVRRKSSSIEVAMRRSCLEKEVVIDSYVDSFQASRIGVEVRAFEPSHIWV